MKAEEYSERGGKYFSERNFDGAIADYTEVIKLEPDNSFAYYKRGLSYTNKKEFDLAIADFTGAIRLEPNKFGEFYLDRAGAYIFKGNKDLAIADLEMAVKIDPQNESYREALRELKSGKIAEGKSGKKPLNGKRKRHLIVITVFAVIGLIGGLTLGMASGGIIFTVISIIFGIGIVPWLAHMKEEWCIQIGHSGFGDFIIYMLFQMIWASIRSPFVGIYQLVTGYYD